MTATSTVATPTRASTLLPNITAGVVLGFSEIIFTVSIASLIFSGPLEENLPRGIAIVMVTSALSILGTAFFASFEGVISGIQDNPSVLLAITTASLIGVVSTPSQLMPTVAALFLTATLLTGATLWLLGYFHLGGLMRYIPYPVIGGFLAGLGWLLIQGSVSVTAEYSLTLEALPGLLQPDQLIRWVPSVAFGLLLFFGTRRIKHNFAMPGMLLLGLVAFLIAFFVSGLTLDQAAERGLLLGNVGGSAAWQPVQPQELAQADWGAVLGQAGNIGAIMILAALSLLLYISGLELELHRDIDLNHELRVAGLLNLATGVLGGVIAFHDIAYTSLNYRVGARGRLAGIVAGLLCLLMLVAGTSIIAYFPRPLLGGLLFFLGLNFLDVWVFEGRKRMVRADFGVVLLMLFIIAATNFIVGVSIGLVLTIVIFVVNYSRGNIFHHKLSGVEVSSNVERNAYQRRALSRLGKQIYLLELQGFIFFGTANTVLEQVRTRLHAPEDEPLTYLILDFRRVTGLDSSAVFSLTKVKDLADGHSFTLVFTHMKQTDRDELERNGLAINERMQFFSDLDYGLEWCEEQLLGTNMATLKLMPFILESQLHALGFADENAVKLKAYLERLEAKSGEYLIQQGDSYSDLYFIEQGQVSVYLELEQDKRMRIHTSGAGTIIGEVGFYLDVPRSASVMADLSTVAYRLTRQAMQEMTANDPELAAAFNELMLRMVAERLVATDRTLSAMNR
jgi:sulfate permease, SulP family